MLGLKSRWSAPLCSQHEVFSYQDLCLKAQPRGPSAKPQRWVIAACRDPRSVFWPPGKAQVLTQLPLTHDFLKPGGGHRQEASLISIDRGSGHYNLRTKSSPPSIFVKSWLELATGYYLGFCIQPLTECLLSLAFVYMQQYNAEEPPQGQHQHFEVSH